MRSNSKKLYSFNRNVTAVCQTLRSENFQELFSSTFKKNIIARGQGLSYGDAAFSKNGCVLLTEYLNRFISFDREKGIIVAESGVTLSDILKIIVPEGWFLPVTPGTKFVSLGGCVASDVHGKNHHKIGSFSAHVLSIELMLAEGVTIQCSAENNADIFWATIGGMGLTGIICKVTLKLISISQSSMFVKHYAAQSIEETLNYLSDPNCDDDYSVAWLDLLHSKKQKERSIIMTAHHASGNISAPVLNDKQFRIPFSCPSWFLNETSLTLFNDFYFKQQAKKNNFTLHYQSYFYSLDKIKNWPYLYGKKGFIQYQCVFPTKNAREGTDSLLRCLRKYSYPVFLAVLKRMGNSSGGILSFPIPGFTLALDLPIKNNLNDLLRDFDEIVMTCGGRVYLAKDSRLTPENFRVMYPRYPEWLAIKNKWDPKGYFNSSLGERLEMF